MQHNKNLLTSAGLSACCHVSAFEKKPSDADVIYQRSHTDGNREVSFTNCYYNAAHTRSRWSILYELLLQCAEHTQYVLIPLRTGKYYFTIAIAMSRTHTVRVNTAMYSMMVSIPSLYSAFQRVGVQLHFRCTIRSGQPHIYIHYHIYIYLNHYLIRR